MCIIKFVLILICIIYITKGDLIPPILKVTDSSSNDENFQYDALETLEQAFQLHPDSFATVSEAWSGLFTQRRNGTWAVSVDCTNFYPPISTTFVEISDSANDVTFMIFGITV